MEPPVGPSLEPLTPSACVLMSGGIDSAACAHFLLANGIAVSAVFIDYGQAASAFEREAALSLAAYLKIPLKQLIVQGGPIFGPGELVGRNGFLISAALFLTKGEPSLIAMGLHAGTPYVDCSEVFAKSMSRIIAEQTDGQVALSTPFISWNKRDVFEYFVSNNLPLDLTYSCEIGAKPPCNTCASCHDRRALGC